MVTGPRENEIYRFRVEGDLYLETQRAALVYKQLTGSSGLATKVNEEALQWMIARASNNLKESIKANRRPQNKSELRKSLFNVIRNRDSHTATANGWRFMVRTKVRKQIDYAYSLEYGDKSQIGRDLFFLFLGPTPPQRRRGVNRVANPTEEQRLTPRTAASGRFRFSNRPDSRRGNKFASRSNDVFRRFRGAGVVRFTNRDFITDRILGPRELGRTDAPKKKGAEFRQSRFKATIRNPVPEYAYGRKAGVDFSSLGVYGALVTQIIQRELDKAGKTSTPLVAGPKPRKARKPKYPVTTTKISDR